MPFRLKENQGRTIIFKQSFEAKIALYFSDKYHLVNAYNLGCLAELAYEEQSQINYVMSMLNTRHVYQPETRKTPRFINEPILLPYNGEKNFASEGITEIKATPDGPTLIDTQGFHYNDDTYNVFVFRGTQQFTDFLSDGYAPQVEFPGGKIHTGFYLNFAAAKEQINKILKKPEYNKCKTIISGHSLGGALATILAAYLKQNYANVPCGQVMVYTFGSPRVGNKAWVDYSTTERPFIHFRHRRKGDPISMLPPPHSNMRLPTLPETILLTHAGASLGAEIGIAVGAIAGPVGSMAGGVAGAATGALILIGGSYIFSSGAYYEAFIHHGQGILLHRDHYGFMVLMGNLPPEIIAVDGKLLNGKEVLLAREFIKNVVAFKDGITPHSISGYVDELRQLLQYGIAGWNHDPKSWLDIHIKTFKHYEAEYLAVKKALIDHVMNPSVKPVAADATDPWSSHPIRTQKETQVMFEDTTNYSLCAKKMAEIEVQKWSQPDSKAELFDLLLGGGTNPSLERELLMFGKPTYSLNTGL